MRPYRCGLFLWGRMPCETLAVRPGSGGDLYPVMSRNPKIPSERNAMEPLSPGEAAPMLAALGNPTRMNAFRCLIEADGHGLNVGTLQARLNIPASTLNHHLTTLNRCGLIRQKRIGREVQNFPSLQNLQQLKSFLGLLGTPGFRFGGFTG